MDGTLPRLYRHFMPSRCLLCRLTTERTGNLCQYCQADLEYFNYSRFDNLLLRPDIADGLKHPGFQQLISLAPYQWPFSHWIGDLKFRERFNLASLMGNQLAALLDWLLSRNPRLGPGLILPMPIHKKRRFQRGYNQSHLLAGIIAKRLQIPFDGSSLKRVRSTKAQTTLGRRLRRANVKNAFAYHGPGAPHVALVDDVITTGATVNEVCKLLKTKGIKEVSVWTICATPKKVKPSDEVKEEPEKISEASDKRKPASRCNDLS